MHATAPPTDEKVPVGHGRHAAVYVPGKQVDADDFSRVSSSNRGSSALIIIPGPEYTMHIHKRFNSFCFNQLQAASSHCSGVAR
jgi:hypothetical protein